MGDRVGNQGRLEGGGEGVVFNTCLQLPLDYFTLHSVLVYSFLSRAQVGHCGG